MPDDRKQAGPNQVNWPSKESNRRPNKPITLPHGFVSLHPEPEGIVHFIGGYFFGTGVSCWYRSLLERLQQRFTVHSYSYSFAQLSLDVRVIKSRNHSKPKNDEIIAT
jgi:hypothetical protein